MVSVELLSILIVVFVGHLYVLLLLPVFEDLYYFYFIVLVYMRFFFLVSLF